MISPGTKAEIDLADFISEPLLLDFVHLQPECIEGEKPRELSDLLIEDGNLAIPVQLKFQDRKKAAPNRDEQRWAKNKLKVALSQLEGAIKNLEKYEINAKHPFRGKVSFPSNYFRCNHGLVIIDYNSKPFALKTLVISSS